MSHPKEDTVKNQTTKHKKIGRTTSPYCWTSRKSLTLKVEIIEGECETFETEVEKEKYKVNKRNPKIASRKCNLKLQNAFLNIFYKSKGRGERPAHARAYRQNLHDPKPGGLKTRNHHAGMKGPRQVPVQDGNVRL